MDRSIINHHWEPKISHDAFWLPKSVVADANTIQKPILQVYAWAKHAGVGVSQWTAEAMGTGQDEGGSTTQWTDNMVRECIWEIAQSMGISNKQGTHPK
jgi:hypothetical protein